MIHYGLRNGRMVAISEDEALAASALLPGEFARHLEHREGLARRFYPVNAWLVENDKPVRVRVAMVIGERLPFVGPAKLATLADGRQVAADLLFPVARHQKPRLMSIDYSQTWCAPLREGTNSHWS